MFHLFVVQDDKKHLVCEFLVAGKEPTGSALDQVLDCCGDCGALDNGWIMGEFGLLQIRVLIRLFFESHGNEVIRVVQWWSPPKSDISDHRRESCPNESSVHRSPSTCTSATSRSWSPGLPKADSRVFSRWELHVEEKMGHRQRRRQRQRQARLKPAKRGQSNVL